MPNELYCTNCEYTDTPERNHGNRCPKCGQRLERNGRPAIYKVGDKVNVHTRSAAPTKGVITDTLQDTDYSWFYQVEVLSEGWVIAEAELSLVEAPKYSLACEYYTREHDSLDALMEDVCTSGMDPNYYVTINDKVTGDLAADLIQF